MKLFFGLACFLLFSCADDRPYLSGHIKRAADAIMIPCDPYNQSSLHTCVVYASAFSEKLAVYDATAEEMVLSPMGYFPLSIKVGPATSDLALVKGSQKPPFFLALDHSEPALYVVPSFPSADKSRLSFTKATKLKLGQDPSNLAAYLSHTHVVVILTYPAAGEIELLSLEQSSGDLDQALKPTRIPVGNKPSDVLVSDDGTLAYIIEEKSPNIWVLDLKSQAVRSFSAGAQADQIFFSRRDFGLGLKNYLAVLTKSSRELRLINADDSLIDANISLDEYPMSAYFPDADCQTCCDGEKNWLAVADIKGHLAYVAIKNNKGKLSLEKTKTLDLISERNLALSKLHVKKIIGGKIEFDESLKRPRQCTKSRNVYLISSYGSDRSLDNSETSHYWTEESHEVEAQGHACEGEASASRLGHKAD